MIKPDIVLCWPRSCDYPLYRQFIKDNRAKFNQVIIVFTETNQGEDYRTFVKEAMLRDWVQFIEPQQIRGDEDWRNIAINAALLQSYNANWIWFTEQDFIVLDGFWNFLEAATMAGAEVVATYDNARMHPCNIFIKRETLMTKTRRNFGIVPNVSDHFSLIQKNLEENHAKIDVFPTATYNHLNGLSHNFTLITRGEPANWRPEEFKEYLEQSLKVSVPLEPKWREFITAYLAYPKAA